MTVRLALLEELRLARLAFKSWEFYLILALAALAITVGYQNRPDYGIDIGGKLDMPFVTGFHQPEHNGSLTYRWSGETATVSFPGVGNPGPVQVNLALNGWRPEGVASPNVRVLANGEEVGKIVPDGTLKTYSFLVRGKTLGLSDLDITIESDTFVPQNDARHLGVFVDSVQVSPLPAADRWIVVPAIPVFPLLIIAVAIAFLWLIQSRVPVRLAAIALFGAILVLAFLIAFHRLGITVFAGQLAALAAAACVLSLLARLASRLLAATRGWRVEGWEIAAISGIFGLAFAIRFGGMIYPQFVSSDLTMHAHRLETVMTGNLVFTNPLPDGRDAPYPPAYYLLLAPFGYLWSNHEMLLALSSSLLDASGVFLVFYIVKRAGFGGLAATLAGFVYSFTPYTFMVFSWGNHTNLFGQWAALLLIAILITVITKPLAPVLSFILVLAASALTFTSHYGSLLLSLLSVALFLMLCLLFLDWQSRIRTLYAALPVVVALILVSLVYYSHFVLLIAGQATALGGGGESSAAGSALGRIGRLSVSDLGLLGAFSPAFLVAGAGVAALARRARVFILAIAAWTLAAGAFGAFGAIVGMESRHELFATTALALAAGVLLAHLGWRSWAGRSVLALLMLFVAWQGMAVWFDRIIFAYH
ncbi:MAG: hypothetical protein M1319_01210 [Chloroflexi bacterium]|nr:hypothetical protein [Chloroflexota bacterium]